MSSSPVSCNHELFLAPAVSVLSQAAQKHLVLHGHTLKIPGWGPSEEPRHCSGSGQSEQDAAAAAAHHTVVVVGVVLCQRE